MLVLSYEKDIKMVKNDFILFIYRIKHCMKKSKDEVSISLNKDVLNYISENFTNRSKFIEYCIIQELIKENKFKEKIEKMIL
jgi:hypothetical protein